MERKPPTHEPPLRLGPRARFDAVEALLHEAGYKESTLLDLLGLGELSGLTTLDPRVVRLENADPLLSALMRLFLLVEPVPRAEAEEGPLASAMEALLALDLVRPGGPSEPGSEADTYHGTVRILPVAGLLLACDRHRNPDGSRPEVLPDIVFPGTAAPTQQFLRILPHGKAGDVLDLGTGTGVAALILSRTAEHVVATDVTDRAVHFTRFNARLNGRDNVEVLRSDVWEALEGRTFDRIVAHPPFVPAPADEQVFRDAGVTGEAITRRVVSGLREHLREGGALYCMCGGWNEPAAPFEVRARGWLGDADDEFDVVFARAADESLEEIVRRVVERVGSGPEAHRLGAWRRQLDAHGFGRWVLGALVVERRGENREDGGPITLARTFGAGTDADAFARALELSRWRQRIEAGEGPGPVLATAQPRFAGGFLSQITFAPGTGGLEAREALAEVDAPFPETLRMEPWMMNILSRLDGRRTVSQVLSEARQDGMVPDGFGLDELAHLVADLVERGYLLMDEEETADAGAIRA
ncbi:MAG: class I SAM-dependent methyltransferase [Gemmatimonadota bacterium]